jgi:predicted metalloprotease
MNLFYKPRRSLLSRLLALAAIVVVLLGSSSGQPAAATGTSATPKFDTFVVSVIKVVHAYWDAKFTQGFNFYYTVVKRGKVVNSPCGLMGDNDLYANTSPAAYCLSNDAVYVSSSWLYNHTSNNGTSPYGVAEVIAHEVGHAVQAELGLLSRGGRVDQVELQADCLAGVWVGDRYRRRLAGDKEKRDAQIQVQSSGDYEYGDPDHHGTADQRVGAWSRGFNGGPGACLRRR